MPSNEKQLLDKALNLSLTEVSLDWLQFKEDYGIHHDNPADEAADRAFFTWQRFRGEHRSNSCLLDEEGRVRGLIIKGSDLKSLRLPELPALEYLCVCQNEQLEEIELVGEAYPLLQYVDWSPNALSAIRLTAELPLLAYLNVSRNKARQLQLPKALPSLKELDACHNQIRECTLPDVLPELTYLFLEGNGMTVLRTQAKLNALRTLNLRENQLTELPKAEYAALETLYLKGNPLSGFGEDLQKGDENGNAVEIIAALRSFAQTGERLNKRAKLIVVGNGRIGKTCLVKRLKGLPCERREVYTHGIAISELEKQHLPAVKTDELTLKVWDFGGQEVFYATHQFFMSEEAAYIYAWTDEAIARKNWEADQTKSPTTDNRPDKWRSHEYWLDNIRMHGRESPIVVVKTHCLDVRSIFPMEPLKTDYTLRHDPVDFDAFSLEPRYLENLAKVMTEALNRLPLLGQPIPKGFHDLVEKIDTLRDEGKVELSKQDFLPLASACQIPERDADAALSYLRKTGEVIHFPDSPRLRNKIYVNPDVLTQRAYKLLESNNYLTEEEGEFTTDYAKDYLGMHWEDLLELLISFQLIYRKTSGGNVVYIAPQYLPPLSKAGRKAYNAFLGNESGKPLRFTLRYLRFLPENVMVNVLSEYGSYALDAVYRDAIFFCKEGQAEGCVIKADEGKREIYVHTTSKPDGDALAREVFEQFVVLSKKAALHIAVKQGEWVDVKPLLQALGTKEVTALPLVSGDGFGKLLDFSFLRVDRALSEEDLSDLDGGKNASEPSPSADDKSQEPETHVNWKAHVSSLVRKNEIEQAIAVMLQHLPEPSASLQRRYAEMKSRRIKGTIMNEEYTTKENQVAEDILSLLREDSLYSPLKPSFMKEYSKWLIGLTIGCIMILLGLNKTGVIKIPGFEFGVTSTTPTEETSSLSTATVIGSVYLNGKPAKSSEVVEVKVKGVNTVNPVSLSGNQFTLRNVPLPADRRLEIALVFPDNIEEARVFNIGESNDGLVDIGGLRVQLEEPAAGSGSTPRITIVNKNIIQTSTNINSEDSGNQDADN